jgi:SAM-dependent methyltransferase
VTAPPLRDEEDAFGRALLDRLDGRAAATVLERDDGHRGRPYPVDVFFAPLAAWPRPEQRLFDAVRGRVLDVGCGAGRHSLEAQERGLETVAVDVSPGALEVSRRRGVRDVRPLALADVDGRLGRFDTVLMLCGNFGLVGDAAGAEHVLGRLHRLTSPGARVVLDSEDPAVDNDASDLAYQERNAARGRLPGQVTIRIRYGPLATPWFELLNVSAGELEVLAAASGWRLAHLEPAEPPDVYAVLEKAG